jgi:hypothetical protein
MLRTIHDPHTGEPVIEVITSTMRLTPDELHYALTNRYYGMGPGHPDHLQHDAVEGAARDFTDHLLRHGSSPRRPDDDPLHQTVWWRRTWTWAAIELTRLGYLDGGRQITLSWEVATRYTATLPVSVLLDRLKKDDDFAEAYLAADGTLDASGVEGETAGELDGFLADLEYDRNATYVTCLGTTERSVYEATLSPTGDSGGRA